MNRDLGVWTYEDCALVGGLHTEICLTFATVDALKNGYEAMFVVDAVGGRSQVVHRTAIERLAHVNGISPKSQS